MERVTYLLSERHNQYAPIRSNGVRFWGYPTRTGGVTAVRAVGIHTAETDPTGRSALNVARWQAFDARGPSSYHALVDSEHLVTTLRDTATAFHIASFNTPTLGLSFATRASMWGRFPAWDALALEHGAIQAADWAKRYSIPRRWLTRAQATGGQRGFVRHSTMDPTRRSDPGRGFPASVFLARVDALVKGTPPPNPPPPPRSWFDMATIEDLRQAVRTELDARLALGNAAKREFEPHQTRTLKQLAEVAAVHAVRANVRVQAMEAALAAIIEADPSTPLTAEDIRKIIADEVVKVEITIRSDAADDG